MKSIVEYVLPLSSCCLSVASGVIIFASGDSLSGESIRAQNVCINSLCDTTDRLVTYRGREFAGSG